MQAAAYNGGNGVSSALTTHQANLSTQTITLLIFCYSLQQWDKILAKVINGSSTSRPSAPTARTTQWRQKKIGTIVPAADLPEE